MRHRNTILGSLIALGLSVSAFSLPQDPTPVHGQIQIQNGANLVQILQLTPQAIVNWGQFNIGAGETVRFLQPSQQAAILNRVTGIDPSLIQGSLQANGRVFLLNPNGILFGPGAVVDVGSFTASTLKMSDEDFINGSFKLTQDRSLPLAALTNQGTIRVAEGGFVVLVSPLLDHQGLILAQAGQVQLGATTQATFSVDGRGLVQFAVPDGFDPQFQGGGQGGAVLLQPGQMSQLLSQVVTNPSLVEAGSFQAGSNGQIMAQGAEGILLNSGQIRVDGGSADAGIIRLDSSQATVLPTNGVLSASSLGGNGGEIRLLSAGRTVSSGTISATASGSGRGGFVEASGKELWLLGRVDVASAAGTGGSILIDPVDITIIDGAGGTFDNPPNPNGLPNPTAAGSGTVSVTGMQGFAAVTLNASNNVLYNGSGFTLGATSLSVIAGNDILLTSSGAIGATTLSLNATRDVVLSGTGSSGFNASSGDVTIVGGRNVSLSANGNLQFSSPTRVAVTATGGNLSLTSAPGATLVFNSPQTSWSAGGNLTVATTSLTPTLGVGALSLNAGNVTLVDPGGTGVSVRAGNLTVNATNDFVGNASNGNLDIRTSVSGINVTAGQSLVSRAPGFSNFQADNGGGVSLSAGSLDLRGNQVFLSGVSGVSLSATNGDVAVRATGLDVGLSSSAGAVNVTASQDITMQAPSNLQFSSASTSSLNATRDLILSDGAGATIVTNGPQTRGTAGRNLFWTATSTAPTLGSTNLTLNAANVSFADPGGTGFSLRAGNLTVNATNNFSGNASNGNLDIRTSASGINLTAGQGLATRSAGFTNFQADNAGGVSLSAPSLDLRGNQVFVSGVNGVNLAATNGDVAVRATGLDLGLSSSAGAVNVTATQDIVMQATSNLQLSSASTTSLNATRDLILSDGAGATIVTNGPQTQGTAGRNLFWTATSTTPTLGSTNLTLNAANVSFADPGGTGFSLRAGNLTVNATNNFLGNASNGNWDVRTSATGINVTSGQSLVVRAAGFTNFQADNAGGVSLTAPSLDLRGNQMFVSGVSNLNLRATNGDASLQALGLDLLLSSTTGAVQVTASQDILLAARSNLQLSSATSTNLDATRDLILTDGAGATIVTNSPRFQATAGRNLLWTASSTTPTLGAVNLTLNAANVTFADPGGTGFSLRANDVTVNATNQFVGNASNGNFDVRTSATGINVTAGQSLTVAAAGFANLEANNGGGVSLTSPSLDLRGNQIFVLGVSDVVLNATNGDAAVRAVGADLNLGSSAGAVRVSGSQDVALRSASNLQLSSGTLTSLNATRDLTLSDGAGATVVINSPENVWTAGRNLSLVSSNTNPTLGSGSLTMNAGNLSLSDSGGSTFSLSAGSFLANVANNFSGSSSNGNWNVQATSGGVNVTAGGNFSLTAPGSKSLSANSDQLSLSAGNLSLTGVDLTALNGSPLKLSSAGNLSVGRLSTSPGANATLSGANIAVDSMSRLSGGNYTITTPGNLTELSAPAAPPTLAGLNITAGRIFNLSGGSAGFSIPTTSTGNPEALVTAGNDSVFQSSAQFTTFNGANLNPGHIDHQTGDIYVNGVLVYGGLPPIIPPDPPPSPPPTPSIPVQAPLTQVEQQQSQLTPEQRSQILSQSNLALGNLGGMSRVLSESEREQLTARMDSIHQTWPLDPFSPTLSLTVPGGKPVVYASELAQLQALLLMSTPQDDPLEKDRGAYNVIVDQELREIWEIRYWRHLLEGFIIWEDRE
ncbi:filamentous hemagglutinin N-terminal domain-containing protein [bacterium]|nr:filamentous hemagglutinin N-terminal domain-containing protein [bacterium]